jgi:hypothetical protein
VTEIVERRRHPRVAAGFALRLEPPRTSTPSAASVHDISRAGVRCISEVPLPAMTVVALRLEIPALDDDRGPTEIACQGVVVRSGVIDGPGEPRFESAIMFQDLDVGAGEAIDRYVYHRINSPTD